MTSRDRALWALAVVISIGILVAPAIWNGFALLQWDTGGYLARTYEGTLVPSRSVIYGIILRAGVPFAFWPVLVLQSALTVWIVALVLRTHGFPRRPALMVGIIAVLSVATTLPWLTAILLTDIFCGLGIIALYLMLMRAEALSRAEHIGLFLLVAISAATHSATLAVMLALVGAAIVLHFFDRKRLPRARLLNAFSALVLGAGLVFAADYAVARRLAWTPGGTSIAFGRMLQDGIVKKYLDAHCPDARLRLCAVKDRIPQDADTWFWGSDLFDSMGRFEGLGQEMGTIAAGAFIEYPWLQLKTAAIATLRQLEHVRTGEGVLPAIWHTRMIIQERTPQLAPAMNASHQERYGIDFELINFVHYPLALLGMASLPFIVWFAYRRKLPKGIGELAATCIIALLANAFVCGALANPHDRYGARIVWLACFVAAVAIQRAAESLRREVATTELAPSPLN